jgi:hypothetical protein
MANFSFRIFILLLSLTACQKMCSKSQEDMSPEEVVEAYLGIALNMEKVEQKYALMEFTTGNLMAAIAGASDETIKKAYIERRYKIERYSLVERKDITPRETQVTFQLSYKEFAEGHPGDEDAAVQVTTENAVVLMKEKSKWLIRDVIGHKTSFDFPVSELSKITPGK